MVAIATDAQAGTITGTVVEAASGKPVASANVSVSGTQFSTTTSADGRFAFPDVPKGTYTINVTYRGFHDSSGGVSVVDDTPVDIKISAYETALGEVVVAANLNAPDQTGISGDPSAVQRAGERCKAAGAKKVIALKVSGAFHSPLMAPAAAGLAAALTAAPFASPVFPVVANATATAVTDANEARRLLREQLTAPVRWVECVHALAALAPEARFIEMGPGTVLGGLLKRIRPDASYLSLGTALEVERFLA